MSATKESSPKDRLHSIFDITHDDSLRKHLRCDDQGTIICKCGKKRWSLDDQDKKAPQGNRLLTKLSLERHVDSHERSMLVAAQETSGKQPSIMGFFQKASSS